MDIVAVIVAGGTGKRMNSEIPKQFLLLNGLPVLMHTINLFYRYSHQIRIIVVLPELHLKEWRKLCEQFSYNVPHEIRMGGKNRFMSVKNGIEGIGDHCLIAVHDGVRPLASQDTLRRCFNTAKRLGNGVPCIVIQESIRKIESVVSIPVVRDEFRLIQTPQVFKSSILKMAYKQKYRKHFTDDATAVENLGYRIHLVKGNAENIKITRPVDLAFAETMIKHLSL